MEGTTTPSSTKLLLGLSYAGLIAVNVVAGIGLFGLPTNGELSDDYPTHVTPAGFTFSIWGIIFTLQFAGVLAIACDRAPTTAVTAIAVPWVVTWLFECLWQFAFFTAPVPASSASDSRRLLTLLPAAVLLVTAYASMLSAGIRLRMRELEEGSGVCPQLISAVVIDLPTGINAGWLAAASGIGVTLVLQIICPNFASEQGGANLVTGLSILAAIVVVVVGSSLKSFFAGLGYAAVTAWACFGITRADEVPSVVEEAATRGIYIAAAAVVVAAAAAAVSYCCFTKDKYTSLRSSQ
mmetsp:Transcript_11038/g.25259  ORF Transcript_11038/g.25259 Transcript_11038/m.25259 type:complete len:295 (+) Transcript_11038:83-967(+)|eukprot:CAMPEP_0178452076 /NCGR_PEP_ID=MMETSP0689_2-20121128/44040_1 /TAXON_ID=160604 /ORGANISM="Amphidinium massartii, Strain CS-259" /LENGTH=294 /DNA_ID=CAMNT_0020077735 /DNA_START=70 /DNA_END=954 /DNA_ORIENTATION=+